MKNLFRKVKNISLLVGMCYFFYSSPFANSFKARCNSITRINKLFPKLIKTQINEGRQAYIVCPLVEENEEIEGDV